jgi:hypothetical protein
MITNEQFLVQRFAEALQKYNSNGDLAYRKYWQGATDTLQTLLNEAFPGWTDLGTTGWFILYEGMSYDAALNAASQEGELFAQDQADYHTEIEPKPEDTYWRNAVTYAERNSITDEDEW